MGLDGGELGVRAGSEISEMLYEIPIEMIL